MFKIRELNNDECLRINEIDASQYIKKAWRNVDGIRTLVTIDYYDPDWPNGFKNHLDGLIDTLNHEGLVLGAFENNRLVAIASLNKHGFDNTSDYALLDQLFISKAYRNRGLGKQLFFKAVEVAKTWHVKRIYICAGSAEETIAFYRAIGCVDVKVVNQRLYDEDPRDIHLEYALY